MIFVGDFYVTSHPHSHPAYKYTNIGSKKRKHRALIKQNGHRRNIPQPFRRRHARRGSPKRAAQSMPLIPDASSLSSIHESRLRKDAGVASRPPAHWIRAARRRRPSPEKGICEGCFSLASSTLDHYPINWLHTFSSTLIKIGDRVMRF